MNRLYIIPEYDDISETMRLSQRYETHFEYNDFFIPSLLDDTEWVKERIEFYKGLDRDRSFDLLHGSFLDIAIHSEDQKIRDISMIRIRQSMDIATELGVRGVVFHTNMIPNFKKDSYVSHWIESNRDFWKTLLAEYPALEVVVENMFDADPNMLYQLAVEMKDEERFGVCFDYAHASAFGQEIKEWVDKLLPFTKHLHINDNDLKSDLHLSIGSGEIDWQQFSRCMVECGTTCSALIEVRGTKNQEESLEYMQKNKIYPFTENKAQSGG